MNDFRKNLGDKINKYVKLNNLTYIGLEKMGIASISDIVRRGSTTFNTLFDLSHCLKVDIRNLLVFSDYTYKFKNSFESIEEFFVFIGEQFKKFRVQKGFRAIDISKSVAMLYEFEKGKKSISLKKFYIYLGKLGVTPDEFFIGELEKGDKDNCETIMGNNEDESINDERDYTTLLTVQDIFRRVDELEKVRGVKIAKSVIPTRSIMPTIHVFLNICKSLKISPSDFFDFTKRKNEDFEYYKSRIDNKVIIGNIRKIIKADGKNSQKFLRLDNIINFCNNKKIDIKEFLKPRFLEGLEGYGNISLQCAFTQ